MARDAKRQPDGCAANASTGPNRRMRTTWRLRTLFVIAGDLHRSCDPVVVGRQTALFIPAAICVIYRKQLPRRNAVCDSVEESPKLVERAHI